MRRLLVLLMILAWWPVAWGATTFFIDTTDATSTRLGTLAEPYVYPDSALEGSSTTNLYGETCAAGDTFIVRTISTFTLGSHIELFMDGTASNPCVIMGDTGKLTHRHWTTAADTAAARPVFTPASDYYFNQTSDHHWKVHGIAFDEYTLYCWNGSSVGLSIDNCTFTNANHATADIALYLVGCEGTARITNCIFDGGSVGSDDATNLGIGIRTAAGTHLTFVDNCTFHDMATALYGGGIYATNCSFGTVGLDGSNTADNGTPAQPGVFIIGGSLTGNTLLVGSYQTPVARYYLDASKRPMAYFETGYIAGATSNYTTVHAGGAPYSIEYSVTSTSVGTMNPVKLMDFAVYADSAEVRTYTISVLRNVGFDAPTAAQLYLEATYQTTDVGGVCTVTTAQSTEVMSGGTTDSTWTNLTVATPANMPNHKGPVQLTLWLKTYDATAGAYLYVDPKLVATGESYNATFNWGLPDLAYNYTAPAAGNKRVMIIN